MTRRQLSTAEWTAVARLNRLYDETPSGVRADAFADDAGVTPITAKTYLCGLVRAGLAVTVSRAPTSWAPLVTADGLPTAVAAQPPAEAGEAARHLADAERLITDALAGAVSGYRLENRLRTAVLPLLRLARESLQ